MNAPAAYWDRGRLARTERSENYRCSPITSNERGAGEAPAIPVSRAARSLEVIRLRVKHPPGCIFNDAHTNFPYDAAQMRLLTSRIVRRAGFIVAASLLMLVPAWGQAETQNVSVESCAGLYCELSGRGNPIIALHGLGASL